MKKCISLIVLAILLCFVANVFAKPVDVQIARAVALNFYKLNPGAIKKPNLAVVLSYTKTEADNTIDFYVFDVYPVHSFVIVSANDIVNPVIAYSAESYFNHDFLKVGVSDWVNHSAAKISAAVQQNLKATSKIQNAWNAYTNGTNAAAKRGIGAGPLLKTNWNQEPYFNDMCPFNTYDNQRCLTGCVATAMAQIMKYWNYPIQGTGSFSYDNSTPYYTNDLGVLSADFGNTSYNWFNMPNVLNAPNADIALLMYQCGVSVNMNYGDDNQGGSSAYVLADEAPYDKQASEYAYTTYFSYNPNTIAGVHEFYYNEEDWVELMESEIIAGRPVQYEGFDYNTYEGHSWVCDGYDESDLLHMNWGWGGIDNGYFDVSNLNPDLSNFDAGEAALIGIEPIAIVKVAATTSNSVICKGGSSTTLTAKGPKKATYIWSPATGLSCSTCATTTASPNTTTTYMVKTDSSGIYGLAAVVVNVATGIISKFSSDIKTSCSSPANVLFFNSSSNALSYLWEFGDGTTSVEATPSHQYNLPGKYTVKLMATGPCGIDSMTKPEFIKINDNSPSVAGQSICRNQTAILNATGDGTISWFTAPNGGTAIAAGNTFTTPVVTTNATYYAQAEIQYPVTACPPLNNSFGDGSYFTYPNMHSIIFNCYRAQTLVSVDVYADWEGERTINLSDSLGNVISTQTFDVVDGINTLTLNYPIPVSSNLKLSVSGNVSLYRNTANASYPYYSLDSTVVLTNSDAGMPGYYYYFYNWQLKEPDCISNRVPVNVNLVNANAAFNAKVTDKTVDFTAANVNATSFTWDFGDGSTSVEENPSHTYAKLDVYTVKLNEAGTCNDELTQTLDLKALGIDNVLSAESFSITPNPVSASLVMASAITQAEGNYKLNIENILGETILSGTVNLVNGNNKTVIDVSHLTAGLYIFRLTNKNGVIVCRKFVKD